MVATVSSEATATREVDIAVERAVSLSMRQVVVAEVTCRSAADCILSHHANVAVLVSAIPSLHKLQQGILACREPYSRTFTQ